MEEKLIQFIKSEMLHDTEIQINPDTKLISDGIIDSFALVVLQTFIRKEFGKNIPAQKITAESFDTVNQMTEIIIRY
jgi:acyl carrier protein